MRTPAITRLTLPTYDDNTRALAWWLTTWNLYKTAAWVVMIVI